MIFSMFALLVSSWNSPRVTSKALVFILLVELHSFYTSSVPVVVNASFTSGNTKFNLI